MGRKRNPGLQKRGDIWRIDKWIFGERLCESCGTSDLAEAEKYLSRRIEQIRQVRVYGARKPRTFREAATKYLQEKEKKTLYKDAALLTVLDNYIGKLTLVQIHNGTLQTFIDDRKKQKVKNRTINYSLGIIRHILNLAATLWLDENGNTWIAHPPKITLLPTRDARKPYPLSWEEQEALFAELPEHLRQMALFKVNTGCREKEVCQLRWDWEYDVAKQGSSVFVLPETHTKNGLERLVILNDTAQKIIEQVRGQHTEYVFSYRGKPLATMNNTAWQNARKKCDIPVRIHDLKHTFGMRLRAAGVHEEDRKDLLGHKSHSITTHYSAAEISNLIEAANRVCSGANKRPMLALVKRSVSL